MKFRGFPLQHVRQSHVGILAEAELRRRELGHHGPDCADLQPVSWPGRAGVTMCRSKVHAASKCRYSDIPIWFQCQSRSALSHFVWVRTWWIFFFLSELWIYFLFGNGAGGVVLQRSCVGATGPAEVVHDLHMCKKLGPFEWDTYRIPMGYEWGKSGIYRFKNTNDRILGYVWKWGLNPQYMAVKVGKIMMTTRWNCGYPIFRQPPIAKSTVQ